MYKNGGPNCVVHINGYDKLKPFGFSIHGAIDGFSRKLLWLNVVRSNKDPYTVSRLYYDWIIQGGRVPKVIRCDAGTENVLFQEIQTALRCEQVDVRAGGVCCIVGRSTGNQRIESFGVFSSGYLQSNGGTLLDTLKTSAYSLLHGKATWRI